MTPKFYMPCRNGRLKPNEDFIEYLKTFNQIVCVTVAKPKSKATWSMYKYLFGCQYKMILEEMGEYTTEENTQRIHKIMKESHGTTEIREEMYRGVNGNIEKKEELLPKKARDYTVEEMQLFWQGNQQFAAEFLGLNIPDPDPGWKEFWSNRRQAGGNL